VYRNETLSTGSLKAVLLRVNSDIMESVNSNRFLSSTWKGTGEEREKIEKRRKRGYRESEKERERERQRESMH